MRRLLFVALLAIAVAAVGPGQASASTLTVCPSGCAFSQIAPAIATASPGDTIQVGAGTYSGGFTIDKSLKVVGAGAGATIISGGSPVVTIGVPYASTEPTVSIGGVTVTGGVNTSFGFAVVPGGGGISIPAAANFATGATVTISDSVISSNRVQVLQTSSCGTGCTFGGAAGGGIDNAGTLTLNHTTVSNNAAGADLSLTAANSFAIGGGIENYPVGTLTLHASTVTGNHLALTTATANGAPSTAFGGGIDSQGALAVDTSTISGNSISVTNATTNPDTGTLGLGGGIHIAPSGQATVRDSTISGNVVTVTAYDGGGGVGGGGIDDDGTLLLLDSTLSDNHVSTTVTSSVPSFGISSGAGAMEVDGSVTVAGTTFSGNSASQTSPAESGCAQGGAILLASGQPVAISDSRFTGNSAQKSSTSGSGTCALGGAIFNLFSAVTISDGSISGNTASASTSSGTVIVQGGGIANGGTLTLRNTTVTSNSGAATGPSGSAQGGGIWNGDVGFGPSHLTLTDSSITHNALTGSANISIHGGGLFTAFPVTLTNSKITGNTPDNCFGVSC